MRVVSKYSPCSCLINVQRVSISLIVIALFIGIAAGYSQAANAFEFADNSPILQNIANAPEKSWVRLNQNQFVDVWPRKAQRAQPTPGHSFFTGTPISVLEAWGAMAWDSNRAGLIFWGGGHSNYTGNEVYLWNAHSLLWERGSLPSAISSVDESQNVQWFETIGGVFDAPISSHTYDNSEFLPIADRFVTFGGASYTLGSPFIHSDNINANTGPYFWNPAAANPNATGGSDGTQEKPHQFPQVSGGYMWDNRDNMPQTDFSYSLQLHDGVSAYTEEDGKDVLFITMQQNLLKYTVHDVHDASRDRYEIVGRPNGVTFTFQGAGAYDPQRRLFVRSAGDELIYWDLSQGNAHAQRVQLNSNGFDTSRLDQYGMDFDRKRQRFLLWDGGQAVWQLRVPPDLTATWTFQAVSHGVGSDAKPTKNQLNGSILGYETRFKGILGKWKYIPGLDVFLGVADPVRGDIWAYKPRQWNPDQSNRSGSNLGNRVWLDSNRNSVQDNGETGIANVDVYLFDTDFQRIAYEKTSVGGFYQFSDLDAGTYIICFDSTTFPTQLFVTERNVGSFEKDSDAHADDGCTDEITINSGIDNFTYDLGLSPGFQQQKGKIIGSAWIDHDVNGNRSENEPGLSNLLSWLFDEEWNWVAEGSLNSEGILEYQQLSLGGYHLCFDHQSFPDSHLLAPQNNAQLDVLADACSDLLVLSEQDLEKHTQARLITDSNQTGSSLETLAWSDQNADGRRGQGETAIAGLSSWLLDSNWIWVAEGSTDQSGVFRFTDLQAGDYYLCYDSASFPSGSQITPHRHSDNDFFTNGCSDLISIDSQTTLRLQLGLIP